MPLKILMAGLAPPSPEFGAGQIALNLAEALRRRGHDVTLWAPGPRLASIRWYRRIPWARKRLEHVLATEGPFDVVDAPPVLITPGVARSAPVVIARTVQPDLQYAACEIVEAGRRMWRHPLRSLAGIVYTLYLCGLVIRGYHRAHRVLCLGRGEAEWLRKRFPHLKEKVAFYVAAPSPAERERLKQVRALRTASNGAGVRFLWIGRWAPHKGIRPLVRFMRQRLQTHPNDTFTIAGCGNDVAERLPADIRASKRVRIVPFSSREGLFSLLADHDVGLFTSTVEGWGLVLQEMLESGMPVIATETGAVPELRPWFRDLLLAFPPPGDGCLPPPAHAPLDPVYEEEFSWETVANIYEDMCFKFNISAIEIHRKNTDNVELYTE